MVTHLFVYGTLRSGSSANHLLEGGRLVGPTTVAGELHDVGGSYPALVLEGEGSVEGEVWACPEELLAEIDRYEGVESGLFSRARVATGAGTCWTYVAGPALRPRLGDGSRIPSGSWSR